MEVAYFIISVILVSLSGALMPGPVLAVVLRQAPHNRLAGIEAAIGHGLIELPLVVAIAAGFATVLHLAAAHVAVGIAGGAALLWMGIASLRPAPAPAGGPAAAAPRSILRGLAASLNPYFFLWWATAGAAMIAKALTWSIAVLALFYIVHFAVDLAWYGIVGELAHRSLIVGSRWERLLIIVCGIAMIAFGCFFLQDAARIALGACRSALLP